MLGTYCSFGANPIDEIRSVAGSCAEFNTNVPFSSVMVPVLLPLRYMAAYGTGSRDTESRTVPEMLHPATEVWPWIGIDTASSMTVKAAMKINRGLSVMKCVKTLCVYLETC